MCHIATVRQGHSKTRAASNHNIHVSHSHSKWPPVTITFMCHIDTVRQRPPVTITFMCHIATVRQGPPVTITFMCHMATVNGRQ